jgi:hypothetical protein
MGSGSSIISLLLRNDPNIVFIDEERPKDPRIKGFARGIFKQYEWHTLKLFCNTYKIAHVDVTHIFKRFLSYEEVYLLQFRVRTQDIKNHFKLHTRLINVRIFICTAILRLIFSVLIPFVF